MLPTTIVRTFFQPFFLIWPYADHCCRRSDHDQLHLGLPTGLSATFEGLSPSTVFFSTRARVPHIKDDYSTERISILSFISTVYITEQDSVTNVPLSGGESNRWVVCVFVPLGIRYCWSLWTRFCCSASPGRLGISFPLDDSAYPSLLRPSPRLSFLPRTVIIDTPLTLRYRYRFHNT